MKKIIIVFLKLLGFIFIGCILLLTIVYFQEVDPAQVEPTSEMMIFGDSLVLKKNSYSLDSLMEFVGEDKVLPPGYELQALIALSAYPELKNVKVSFELTQTGAPMESNFDILSLLGPKKNRKYRVLLNDAIGTTFDPILLRELPFDAQVGILAHELGHVVYYDRLNALQIGKWGLSYVLDDSFHATHEKTTDLMPVYHGLGWQIYRYALHIRTSEQTKDLYDRFAAAFISKYYLSDFEIYDALMEENYILTSE